MHINVHPTSKLPCSYGVLMNFAEGVEHLTLDEVEQYVKSARSMPTRLSACPEAAAVSDSDSDMVDLSVPRMGSSSDGGRMPDKLRPRRTTSEAGQRGLGEERSATKGGERKHGRSSSENVRVNEEKCASPGGESAGYGTRVAAVASSGGARKKGEKAQREETRHEGSSSREGRLKARGLVSGERKNKSQRNRLGGEAATGTIGDTKSTTNSVCDKTSSQRNFSRKDELAGNESVSEHEADGTESRESRKSSSSGEEESVREEWGLQDEDISDFDIASREELGLTLDVDRETENSPDSPTGGNTIAREKQLEEEEEISGNGSESSQEGASTDGSAGSTVQGRQGDDASGSVLSQDDDVIPEGADSGGGDLGEIAVVGRAFDVHDSPDKTWGVLLGKLLRELQDRGHYTLRSRKRTKVRRVFTTISSASICRLNFSVAVPVVGMLNAAAIPHAHL